jgi:trk system potassium uptake protein TrkA
MEVIIVGCGRVGAAVALLLSEEGHNVSVIDKRNESFDRLGKTFNGVCLNGNGFDVDTLIKAGVKTADAVVVVTNGDNTNIMASQVAKKIFNVPKVIARLYDPKRAEIYQRLGLDILSGTTLVASMIRDKLIETNFSSYFIENKGLGILEVKIPHKLVGKKVKNLNKTNKFIIATVVKKTETVIPSPETVLDEGDTIVGVVKTENVDEIKSIFGLE